MSEDKKTEEKDEFCHGCGRTAQLCSPTLCFECCDGRGHDEARKAKLTPDTLIGKAHTAIPTPPRNQIAEWHSVFTAPTPQLRIKNEELRIGRPDGNPPCPIHQVGMQRFGRGYLCPVDDCCQMYKDGQYYNGQHGHLGEAKPTYQPGPEELHREDDEDLDQDDPSEDGPRPLLCFEQDLDAGIAAGQELATKGYALMPEGYWMVSSDHMAKLRAQAAHVAAKLRAARASGTHADFSNTQASLDELARLLPGGAR